MLVHFLSFSFNISPNGSYWAKGPFSTCKKSDILLAAYHSLSIFRERKDDGHKRHLNISFSRSLNVLFWFADGFEDRNSDRFPPIGKTVSAPR